MPKINNLLRYLHTHLKKPGDFVRINIISYNNYRKKRWHFANEIHVEMIKKDDRFAFHYYNSGTSEKRDFLTWMGVRNYIERNYPPEYFVYYYSKPDYVLKSWETFINIKHLFEMTSDEAYSWEIILARHLGHLNGRRLKGFRILNNTTKRCVMCRNKADITAVFEYNHSYYSVYYCKNCWSLTVESLIDESLRTTLSFIKSKMIGLCERKNQ